jgi:hypothetical protein
MTCASYKLEKKEGEIQKDAYSHPIVVFYRRPMFPYHSRPKDKIKT